MFAVAILLIEDQHERHFPIFLHSGGYVRRGLCPQGVMSAGGFIQGVMSAGGFVCRGLCPRFI